MQKLIENTKWSTEENQNFQDIVRQMNFTQSQLEILNLQIQKFQSSEQISRFLFDNQENRNKLEECLIKEGSQTMEFEKDWTHQELQNLQQKLSKQIKSEQEINEILQFVEKNKMDRGLVEKVTQYEFQTADQFTKLVGMIFESNSNPVVEQPTPFQPNKEQAQTNNQQIINDLFKEFEILNKRSNQELINLLQQVYSQLENQQQLNLNYISFTPSPYLLYEDLLFLCLKVKENFQYYPRPAQLLSVIELYNHDPNKGRLAQIYTGEGKSLIVAMLAVLLNKKKNSNVDVVTSSPILATRDAEQLEQFYAAFSVSVSHNVSEAKISSIGMLPCYSCSVIYGDPHSFEADILRHEYSERETMGNRKQEYIIVDEVDSMLIDGNSHKTLLSAPVPGMLDLTKVLRLIWDEICKVESNLSTENKVMIADQDNYYSVDLMEYIESTLNLQLKEALYQFIPKYRLKYINFMKKTWIENAIHAKYQLHKDCHYQIENNRVRIIDYQNTGVIHGDNMHWEKGLHQFVQLKHNLPITPLTINTNYLSNVTFFKRYKNKILGLTGTLGSQVTQNLLAKEYNVDFVFIPPYKKRLLKEEKGYAAHSEEEWKNAIFQAVQQQMNMKRAVLIINQTIYDVKKIQEYLQQKNCNSIAYFDDSQKIDHEVKPGALIIATNLAGRGTDFITNQELDDNGGLHVIMSFLPRNIRIQQQGFGRTGRQGKKGTAQLIVNYEENCYLGNLQVDALQDIITFEILKENIINPTSLDTLVILRNVNEQFYSDEIEKEMKRLENEDRCFEKFCKIAKGMVNFKEQRSAFQQLEERWGLYLEENQETGLNENDIEKILNSNDAQNPKYLILDGLQNKSLEKFRQAATISENDPSAYYYQGLYQIKENDFQKGISSLQKAKQLFQQKIDDEKGFSSALKLNRFQIDQFSNNPNEQSNMLPKFEFDINPILISQEKGCSQQSEHVSQINQEKQRLKKHPQQQSSDIVNKNNEYENQGNQGNENQGNYGNENENTDKKNQNNNKKLDCNDEKVKNHVKVYKDFIKNINDILATFKQFNPEQENIKVDIVPFVNKKQKKNGDENNSYIDKQEIINDGPLPVIGKVTKIQKEKKKKKWWQYLAMFAIGLGQFLVACAINALSCGAALPIGKAFITGGISDMVYSVTAAWKGLEIDWGAWGQNKMINIASALVLAGPSGIKEALQIGCKGFQSLKQIGVSEFLNQIPRVTVDGLKKAGFWLSDLDKVEIKNQYQTLQQIQETASKTGNINQILNLATEVLNDQVQNGTISQGTSKELFDFINRCFQESKGTVGGFQNKFCEEAKKFLKLQIVKRKTKKSENELKQEVLEICQVQGNKKYHGLQNRIKEYQQYEERLNNEIKNFKGNFQICYNEDCELKKIILELDITFQQFSHQKEVDQFINSNMIQTYLNSKFDINDEDIQNECDKLKIPNKNSMIQFYQNVIRPQIMMVCEEFKGLFQNTEPMAIIFKHQFEIHRKEKVQKINSQGIQLADQQEYFKRQRTQYIQNPYALNQSIERFNIQAQQFEENINQMNQISQVNTNELAQNIINQMKNKQLIKNDGVTISNTFISEFQHYLNHQNYNNMMIQLLQETMESTLQELANFKQNSKIKPFSTVLFKAVEIEILDEIEKYIFKSRIKKQDRIITSQYD